MSDSIRNQLLGLGFKSVPKPASAPVPRPDAATRRGRNEGPRSDARKPSAHAQPRPDSRRQKPAAPRDRAELDLARAYAIRAQREKDERIEAERQKQEQARVRREAKTRLGELLKDKALNDPAAEIARHFDYGGKIKRIHVTPAQLTALNAGELGVIQFDGRYLLVDAALLAQAEVIFAPAIALKVDPDAPAGDDPYSDPRYQVPDDLVW